jgi:O-antigen ligase
VYESWNYSALQNLVGLAYLLRLIMYISFFYLLVTSTSEIKKMAYKSFWIFVILVPLFCIIQYSLYPDLRNLYYLGWDPHLSRVFGSFFDSSVTGTILTLIFFWILVFIKDPIKKNASLILKLFLMLVVFILILLTYSRITYIEFILGIIWFCYAKIGLIKTAGLIGVFAALLILLPRPFGESVKLERIFTIQSRIEDYQQGIQLFLHNPIIGYGFDRLKYVRGIDVASHAGNYSSSFLTILVSSGILGFAGFIYFLSRLYMSIPKEMRVFLIIILAGSLFDNLFLDNFVLLTLFLILSISIIRPSDR